MATPPGNGDRLERISKRVYELEVWRWQRVEPSLRESEQVRSDLVPKVRDMIDQDKVAGQVAAELKANRELLEQRQGRRWEWWKVLAAVVGALVAVSMLIVQLLILSNVVNGGTP